MMASRPGNAPDVARRRFVAVQSGLAAAFTIAMLAAGTFISRVDQTVYRWLLALIPILLLVAWAWRFLEMIRADDERMQAIHFRAIALGAGLVVLAVSLWGIFERLIGAPAIPAFFQLPAFAMIYGWAMSYFGNRG